MISMFFWFQGYRLNWLSALGSNSRRLGLISGTNETNKEKNKQQNFKNQTYLADINPCTNI